MNRVWKEVRVMYQDLRPSLLRLGYTDRYFLLHIDSGKWSVGLDKNEDGQNEAFTSFEAKHKKHYGEYFGVKIK